MLFLLLFLVRFDPRMCMSIGASSLRCPCARSAASAARMRGGGGAAMGRWHGRCDGACGVQHRAGRARASGRQGAGIGSARQAHPTPSGRAAGRRRPSTGNSGGGRRDSGAGRIISARLRGWALHARYAAPSAVRVSRHPAGGRCSGAGSRPWGRPLLSSRMSSA